MPEGFAVVGIETFLDGVCDVISLCPAHLTSTLFLVELVGRPVVGLVYPSEEAFLLAEHAFERSCNPWKVGAFGCYFMGDVFIDSGKKGLFEVGQQGFDG